LSIAGKIQTLYFHNSSEEIQKIATYAAKTYSFFWGGGGFDFQHIPPMPAIFPQTLSFHTMTQRNMPFYSCPKAAGY